MIFRKILSFCLAALLVLGVSAALAEATAAPEATQEAYANPFVLMEIKDISGDPFDVSVFSGKPFMLNVWASWCGPCVSEMPDLDALSKEYADRISIIGLMGDAVMPGSDGKLAINQDELDGARALYEKLAISYPSLIPNEFMISLMQQIPVQYFPTTIFFNGEGYPVTMQVGSMGKEDWVKVIDQVLADIQGKKGE